jgi:hypothetical protein
LKNIHFVNAMKVILIPKTRYSTTHLALLHIAILLRRPSCGTYKLIPALPIRNSK